MINDIRNTVLAILSKDNNGYLTPEQFNLYADLSQTEIFEQYQYDYSYAINKMNAHMHTSGLGDVPARIAETMNKFRENTALAFDGPTVSFTIPTDCFLIDTITASSEVVDGVDQGDLNRLASSLDTAPTVDYPVYVKVGGVLKVYPQSIVSADISYIRYPKKPKWTYVSLIEGEPLFDQGNADYQDFELPNSEKTNLTVKILQYAGVQISSEEVARAAKTDEVQEKQEHR